MVSRRLDPVDDPVPRPDLTPEQHRILARLQAASAAHAIRVAADPLAAWERGGALRLCYPDPNAPSERDVLIEDLPVEVREHVEREASRAALSQRYGRFAADPDPEARYGAALAEVLMQPGLSEDDRSVMEAQMDIESMDEYLTARQRLLAGMDPADAAAVAEGIVTGTTPATPAAREADALAAAIAAVRPWRETPPRPRTPVVDGGLVYRGGLTLLIASRGQGKTTLAAWQAAELDRAGETVLVVNDDDPETWRASLDEAGAGEHVYTASAYEVPASHLGAVLDAFGATVLFVDNWQRLAAAWGIHDHGGPNQDEGIEHVIRPLQREAERLDLAVVIITNPPHSAPQRARGGAKLAEECDVERVISTNFGSRVSTIRTPDGGKARRIERDAGSFRWRSDQSGYDRVVGEVAAEPPVSAERIAEVAATVAELSAEHGRPPSASAITKAIGGRAAEARRAVEAAHDEGQIAQVVTPPGGQHTARYYEGASGV